MTAFKTCLSLAGRIWRPADPAGYDFTSEPQVRGLLRFRAVQQRSAATVLARTALGVRGFADRRATS
ncbi:hypothetical protein AB0M86_19085 [Streptomyces sp. NPDC051639]|uniref:hypothetical protein n=1 Tax=unclassified Streptomyces TaxID=2593676 RepID=UPI002E33794B|nr:hypothetical protein [Streptomyces sp. NBC_01455]